MKINIQDMGNTYYIAAIELSSSKISGAVGIETHEGIRILATASTPVNGFIAKGVVRNVDETSNAINCIINNLEQKLDEKYKVSIKRAYISFAGLTVHSIKSKVTRGFETYTKITPDIINDMARENDEMFDAPEGYIRVRSITQEYKIDGKIDNNPVGAPTMTIEGNYLNLVIKQQYFNQLEECFAQAKIEISDSFSAARMDADIMLSKDARRNGCALVNIGADTTTIAVYNNEQLRKLTVVPLGSRNITRDISCEKLSFDQAEAIKICRGYSSQIAENDPIDNATVDNIISGRMSEILQNVKYQINESGEIINRIIFTGGGSRLKNMELLLEEYLPDFKTSILSDPKLAFECVPGVNTIGIFTTALYGLLNKGKDNCCEIINQTPPPPPINGTLFGNEPAVNEKPQKTSPVKEESKETPEKPQQKDTAKKVKEPKKPKPNPFGDLFGNFRDTMHGLIKSATSEDPEQDTDNDE